MKFRRLLALSATSVAAAGLISVALVPAQQQQASAHGTMSNPPSRVYYCKTRDNVENPSNPACRAAVAAGGTQPFYDWNEVNQLEAAGRHRQIIPDGRLCSGGRDKYRGLDLVRSDWPAQRISAGNLTIQYHASAPHSNSNFEFYITRSGWSPTQPLRWGDLVHLRTFTNQNPTTFTNWTIPIPARTGRHIIYSIWQRVVGSNEAFYTCSDVTFGGGSEPPPTEPPPTEPPPNNPPPTPPPGGTWTAGTAYSVGTMVTYNGASYTCRQAHTALAGWEPPNAAALWSLG